MRVSALQSDLARHGWYHGRIDDKYGPLTREAVLRGLTAGPDTPLTADDIRYGAMSIGVPPALVQAVRMVEASGDAFIDGRPALLFEPHRFSRATGRRFDVSNPTVSYPRWDRTRYPAHQLSRYAQLLEAVGLNVDAGFASASYGAFQVLGENYAACGFSSPWAFALAQSHDERAQLAGFLAFVRSRGLLGALRRRDWDTFARGYNGTAAAANHYPQRLAAAVLKAEKEGWQ